MTIKELFELIANLVDEYGVVKVEYTLNFIFDAIRSWEEK